MGASITGKRRDSLLSFLDLPSLLSLIFICSPLLLALVRSNYFGWSPSSAADAIYANAAITSAAFDEAATGIYISAADRDGLPVPHPDPTSITRVELRPFFSAHINAQRTWFASPGTHFYSKALSSMLGVVKTQAVPTRKVARTVALAHAHRLPPRSSNKRKGSKLFFLFATSPERAMQQSEYWRHYLYWGPGSTAFARNDDDAPEDDRRGPGCLVVDNTEMRSNPGEPVKGVDPERPAMYEAQSYFRGLNLSCTMSPGLQESSVYGHRQRYGVNYGATTSIERVLSLVVLGWQAAQYEQRDTEWFLILDDDTFFVDPHNLIDALGKYDSDQDWFLGGHSEAEIQQYYWGRIAYGGGGIIISRGLMKKMYDSYEQCRSTPVVNFESQGDGKLTYCAAVATGQVHEFNKLLGVKTRLNELATQWGTNNLVTPLEGLNQMDIGDDSSGFFQSGLEVLSVHHYNTWTMIFPYRHIDNLPFAPDHKHVDVRVVSLRLLAAAAWALGGSNMFRRSVFDDGRVVLTLGYSITFHAQPLTPADLAKTEWTYHPDFEPTRPHRPGLIEGFDKLTYYLSYVVIEDDETHARGLLLSEPQRRHVRKVRIGYKCTWRDLKDFRTNWYENLAQPVTDIETVMFLPLVD
ncbi:glycosyltransferase family 31 protein [Mixia osmundae IAM 14324]|uniref:Fringe-like glycosyltransferase domain-containing protein n=1 Tax=Mixia osmundae (strain CBS 9802 / IAM 14324 / JCM 22182 / KY 12970) TaxID=764103 RepID=G7E4Z4_MIXOS|nr:glycosyltransferase family 31 protein [Mixia osmundae IAM 14324]KEI37765.1 glycosyltransferase family 31 protein [Mixia osmundae IAM 14324]GAA97904.1 hypothetical protein E5Q_04584 [Mixia osmundae IAM 14324]